MIKLLLVSAAAMLVATPAQSKPLKWMDGPPGLPSGAKMAVVSGDPGKEGDFKVQIKMPANYAVQAHHHPTDERVSVVSVNMAADMNHWVFTRAPATIEVRSKGPFQITYVDPKDDPRGAQ